MNQCKRLSDCPVERLAQCRGEPVPPAGDVEVLMISLKDHKIGQSALLEHIESLKADRTRLTAERDGLRHEVRDLKRWRDLALQFDNHRLAALWHLKALLQSSEHEGAAHDFLSSPPLSSSEIVAERDALKSELTKARELLHSLQSEFHSFTERWNQIDMALPHQYTPNPIAHNVDESCGQDGEAATKENKQAALDAVDWWDKHCESPEGVKDAEAANTVNGMTDAEWQDRDDQDRQELERD